MTLIKTRDWYFTKNDEARGYIQPHALNELWFHTGTACNLSCPFCLEGSEPGDKRLEPMKLNDVQNYMDEAIELGCQRFSFTGGEPFVIKEFHKILNHAAQRLPCLVLTNATEPMQQRLQQLVELRQLPNPIAFRVSIDFPDEQRHDEGRGQGSFKSALAGIHKLIELGFEVSIARQMKQGENKNEIEQQFNALMSAHGISENLPIVAFPDFLSPHSEAEVPEISENCMTQYQNEENRKSFMCAYSKMIVKTNGSCKVYACTLVDDHPGYDLGTSLKKSMEERIMLKHHRCYSCFAFGASCSG